ncbi:hypothetical protein NEFER03_0427 [Nematocida sp. LUAm3]|nr:hypothetical protein NEFER03_0427 [Nematocida sp. LUAm3]KAI5175885.1 hypothetical protein NEFER02_1745 [Nematocida sp. LUAm2]KAI5178733.1 hypothetical protein NEFER01_1852 [Nematocida sp. LUAm1]
MRLKYLLGVLLKESLTYSLPDEKICQYVGTNLLLSGLCQLQKEKLNILHPWMRGQNLPNPIGSISSNNSLDRSLNFITSPGAQPTGNLQNPCKDVSLCLPNKNLLITIGSTDKNGQSINDAISKLVKQEAILLNSSLNSSLSNSTGNPSGNLIGNSLGNPSGNSTGALMDTLIGDTTDNTADGPLVEVSSLGHSASERLQTRKERRRDLDEEYSSDDSSYTRRRHPRRNRKVKEERRRIHEVPHSADTTPYAEDSSYDTPHRHLHHLSRDKPFYTLHDMIHTDTHSPNDTTYNAPYNTPYNAPYDSHNGHPSYNSQNSLTHHVHGEVPYDASDVVRHSAERLDHLIRLLEEEKLQRGAPITQQLPVQPPITPPVTQYAPQPTQYAQQPTITQQPMQYAQPPVQSPVTQYAPQPPVQYTQQAPVTQQPVAQYAPQQPVQYVPQAPVAPVAQPPIQYVQAPVPQQPQVVEYEMPQPGNTPITGNLELMPSTNQIYGKPKKIHAQVYYSVPTQTYVPSGNPEDTVYVRATRLLNK